MALTAAQLNTVYNNVLFRNVDQGGITYFANRSDISDAQVRQQIELSTEATTYVTPVVRLYQEVLGRVPDATGLKFFVGEVRGGFSLAQIAQQMISSQEFASKTTATSGVVDATDLSNTNQLVSDAFQSILGRQPATSEFSYFQGMSPAMILAGVAGSTEAAQTNAANVTTFLDSAALGTPNNGSLNNQTSSQPGGQTGTVTATLSLNQDNLGGTGKGGDVFNAPLLTTAFGNQAQSLQSGDSIVDTGGSASNPNVLNATFNAAGVLGGVTLNGVQTLNLTNFSGGTAGLTANALTGVLTVNNVGSTNEVDVGANAAGSGLSSAVTSVGVSNTTAATKVFVQASQLTGSSDAITLNLNNAGTTSAAATVVFGADSGTNGYEKINLAASGSNNVTLSENGGTTAKNIVVTGSGSLKISATTAAEFANVATIDASAATGAVTITGGTSANGLLTNDTTSLTSFKGGTANDSLDVSNLTAFSALTADGGTGTNTIIVSNAIATAGTTVNNVTNFQNLGINNFAGSVDLSKFTSVGINDINLYGTTAGTGTITNGTSTFTLQENSASNGQAFSITAAGTGTTDVFNDILGTSTTGDTSGSHTVVGYETVNLTSQGGANTIGALTLTASTGGSEALNILGSQTLNIGGAVTLSGNGSSIIITDTAAVTITGSVTAATIDASASGGLTMSAVSGQANGGTTGDVIKGATAFANTLYGSVGNDVITGGSQGDNIHTAGGGDTINLGTAGKVDNIFLTEGANSVTTTGDKAVAGYFGVAPGAAATTIAASTAADVSTVNNFTVGSANVAGSDILNIKASAFANATGTTGVLVQGDGHTIVSGGTDVVINSVSAGGTLAANATLIEITGATFTDATALATALKGGSSVNFGGTGVANNGASHLLFAYSDTTGNTRIADVDVVNSTGAAITSTGAATNVFASDLVKLTGVALSTVDAHNVHIL